MRTVMLAFFVFLVASFGFLVAGCGDTDDDPGEEKEVYQDKNDGEEEEEKEERYYVSVEGSYLHMRKTPGTEDKPDDDIIARLEHNEEIEIIDKHDNSREKDGYVWWEIYCPAEDREGWVASEFVTVEEELEEEENGTDSENDRDYIYESGGSLKYSGLDLFQSQMEEVIEVYGEPENREALHEGYVTLEYPELTMNFEEQSDGAGFTLDSLFVYSGRVLDFEMDMTLEDIEEKMGAPEDSYVNPSGGHYETVYTYENFTMKVKIKEEEEADIAPYVVSFRP